LRPLSRLCFVCWRSFRDFCWSRLSAHRPDLLRRGPGRSGPEGLRPGGVRRHDHDQHREGQGAQRHPGQAVVIRGISCASVILNLFSLRFALLLFEQSFDRLLSPYSDLIFLSLMAASGEKTQYVFSIVIERNGVTFSELCGPIVPNLTNWLPTVQVHQARSFVSAGDLISQYSHS
jgi:hypothetical protein